MQLTVAEVVALFGPFVKYTVKDIDKAASSYLFELGSYIIIVKQLSSLNYFY